jgi:putative endonuclease
MSTTNEPRHQLGRAGERLAEQFLTKHGLKLVARNHGTPVGEIDLIMRDRETVVFVEVKTRRDRNLADPEDAVRPDKQRRMSKAARWFIHDKRWDDKPCRFDIVAVLLPESGPPEIEHFPDAFLPAS